jgi:drug/metabolite transporter (DMT)-like permease
MDFPRSIRPSDRPFLALLFSGTPARRDFQGRPGRKLSVVVALALAITFLGEKLDLREGIGAGLIVLGAIVLAWK